MTTTRYGDSGILPRTNVYAARTMLKHAMPVVVLDKFGQVKELPPNKTDTIKFRRPRTFTAASTPLVEGVTPTATQFGYDDVQTTLKQYGMVVEITDKISDLAEDPVLRDASVQCGENIGRTIEALTYGVVKAGTNVIYANGTSRTDVNTPVSLAKLRAAARSLKSQKAMKISSILASSPNYATRAVEASWVVVCHTDCESDIRNLAGFLPTAQYGVRNTLHEHEIGSVEEFRFVASPDLDPFADAGGAAGSMVTTGGTSADVYPMLIFGKEAYGTVPLRGQGAVEPSIIPVNQKTKDYPLGQRGYVGWKTWFAAVILNQLWQIRLEVASTAL